MAPDLIFHDNNIRLFSLIWIQENAKQFNYLLGDGITCRHSLDMPVQKLREVRHLMISVIEDIDNSIEAIEQADSVSDELGFKKQG